ncbi:MAG: response regulator [Pseudomonas sp.]|uniref:response regulator n=1 Tax=Pseudomonas sp. TaxID=306 RepID=UPI003BB77DF8
MWRILVVEDSPTNMLLTVDILGFAGHQVLEATTGAEGLDKARTEHPQIILMDLHLPDMDGVEVTRILKADPHTQHIPVIAVTASVRAGEGKPLLDAGFDGYLGKPISYKEFLVEVDAAVLRCRGEQSV